jgi:hypothetical protein
VEGREEEREGGRGGGKKRGREEEREGKKEGLFSQHTSPLSEHFFKIHTNTCITPCVHMYIILNIVEHVN